MARQLISIKSVNGDVLKGYSWVTENPVGNVFIVTGMEEHSLRYDEFANFLNKNSYNIYCIDYYGQGANVDDCSKLGLVPSSAFSKFVRAFDDLVKKYSLKGKPSIVFGHSMGSFLIQDYIQRYSKHADKAIIMGSNGDNAKLAYSFGYPLSKLVCKISGEETKAKLLKSLATGSFAKSVKHRRTDCDWLSYNEKNVDDYIADPKSGITSPNIFYREMLKGNHRLYKAKFLSKISNDLKILITSGEDDPVGAFGKGPKRLKKMYKRLGIKDVELKLYKQMRHEILNENNKEIVYKDILEFINK